MIRIKVGKLLAAKRARGEYYADEEDGLYHVFHSETGHSHASYANRPEAEAYAKEMNDATCYAKSMDKHRRGTSNDG